MKKFLAMLALLVFLLPMAGSAADKVHKNLRFIELTPTVDTSAFASGDLIGAAALVFNNATSGDSSSAGTRGGVIQSVVITDLAKQSANLDLVIFDANPSNTTFTENSAFDPHDTDILNIIGVVAITDWKAFSDNSAGVANNLAIPFILDTGNVLYGALVSRGAPTYAATDLTIRLGIITQ